MSTIIYHHPTTIKLPVTFCLNYPLLLTSNFIPTLQYHHLLIISVILGQGFVIAQYYLFIPLFIFTKKHLHLIHQSTNRLEHLVSVLLLLIWFLQHDNLYFHSCCRDLYGSILSDSCIIVHFVVLNGINRKICLFHRLGSRNSSSSTV